MTAAALTGLRPDPTGLWDLRRLLAAFAAGGPGPGATAPADDSGAGPSDEVRALVDRAVGGDAAAFGQLYDRYGDQVYRYVYYRVGSPQLAEDLTSETFLRALRRVSSFTWQGRDVGAWFVTIARNLVTDHYRSGRYRLEVTTADLVETAGDRAEDGGPEAEVLGRLTNARLLEAVRELGSEQQECVSLRFLQGMSLAETAVTMDKSESAIKALQYRAVRTLARRLPPGSL